jgi:hypothetical protein
MTWVDAVLIVVFGLVYVPGWLFTVRPFAVASLERQMERFERNRKRAQKALPSSWEHYFPAGPVQPTSRARRIAALTGAALATVWPVAWLASRFTNSLRTSDEVARAQRAENERLQAIIDDFDARGGVA